MEVDSVYIPECLLLNIDTVEGMSGSPIFEENNDEEVIGMLIGSVHQNNYKIALKFLI